MTRIVPSAEYPAFVKTLPPPVHVAVADGGYEVEWFDKPPVQDNLLLSGCDRVERAAGCDSGVRGVLGHEADDSKESQVESLTSRPAFTYDTNPIACERMACARGRKAA